MCRQCFFQLFSPPAVAWLIRFDRWAFHLPGLLFGHHYFVDPQCVDVMEAEVPVAPAVTRAGTLFVMPDTTQFVSRRGLHLHDHDSASRAVSFSRHIIDALRAAHPRVPGELRLALGDYTHVEQTDNSKIVIDPFGFVVGYLGVSFGVGDVVRGAAVTAYDCNFSAGDVRYLRNTSSVKINERTPDLLVAPASSL